MNKLTWALQILLALAFGSAGVMKLVTPHPQLIANGMAWAEDFSATQVRMSRGTGGRHRVGGAGGDWHHANPQAGVRALTASPPAHSGARPRPAAAVSSANERTAART